MAFLEDISPEQERDPLFWRNTAHRLKEAADAAWSGFDTARRMHEHERGPFFRRHGSEAPDNAYLDLGEVYAYLIGLAIEFLSIAVLVERDPELFSNAFEAHRILGLLHDCGIEPSPEQQRVLQGIESSLQWRRRNTLRVDQVDESTRRAMRDWPHPAAQVSKQSKEELDALYRDLDQRLDRSET